MTSVPSLLVLFSLAAFPDEKDKEKKPTFTISKETTFVTGPKYPDGRINYIDALNEMRSKGVTPRTNANVLLVQAIGPKPEGAKMPPAYFKWIGIDEPAEKGDYFISLEQFVMDFDKDDARPMNQLYDEMERASQRPWGAKDFPHIAAWLKANEKPLAMVSEAARRPHYFAPLTLHETKNPMLIGALLPYVQKQRAVGSALAMRAMLRVSEGKTDEAWQDLLTVHRLARHMGKGSTLIEGLVGVALDSIAASGDIAFIAESKLDSKKLLACLRDLQSLPPRPPFADLIDTGERFFFLDSTMMLEREGVKGLDALAGGAPTKGNPYALLEKLVFKDINWDPALRKANQFYDRMVAAMREKDVIVRDNKLAEIEKEIKTIKAKASPVALIFGGKSGTERALIIGDILTALVVPALSKVATAETRTQQSLLNTQTAFALEAYRSDKGRYPMTLDELTPKYLKTAPVDLFTGKAPVYRPEEKGYLLYSVGPNREDENGRFFDDDPPGDDPNVRMPLPAWKARP